MSPQTAWKFTPETRLTVRHVWSFAEPDRHLFVEAVKHGKQSLREFRATHLEVTVDGGAVVRVHAAGVVQHDGRDGPEFTSEQWTGEPWPDAAVPFLHSVTALTPVRQGVSESRQPTLWGAG